MPVILKSISHVFDEAIAEVDISIKQIDELMFVAQVAVLGQDGKAATESREVFQRMIDLTSYLKEITRKQTKYAMESFHLDWLNDILCAALYIIEPADFMERARIASEFNIKNFDNLGFAFWVRRMGKSFAIILGCIAILFCLRKGTMAVQSVNIKSAYSTAIQCTSHVSNLFAYFKLESVDPIRTLSVNGIKFINWYGVRELQSGREDISNFPEDCFSHIQLLSGDDDAGRGMTKQIYILDETLFMTDAAVRTTLLNTRRSGSIAFCMSSEDPKNQNPVLERMRNVSDIATVSIVGNMCNDCIRAKLTSCVHRSTPAWNTNSRRLDRILKALLVGDVALNMLELYGSSILNCGNAFSIPPYSSLSTFMFQKPHTPFRALMAVIDPSVSKQAEGSFTCYMLFGIPSYERNVEFQRNNACYILDVVFTKEGTLEQKCGMFIRRFMEFRKDRDNAEWANLPVIWVPEKNQGELPDLLHKQLTSGVRPLMCGWAIYSEKESALEGLYGFQTTDHTKFAGSLYLQAWLGDKDDKSQKNQLLFYSKISEVLVVRVLNEISNQQRKSTPYGNNALPQFISPQGQFDDAINCIFIKSVAHERLVKMPNVMLFTLRKAHMLHPNCPKYTTGHSEYVEETSDLFHNLITF